ncbi:MAG: hypothetical protein K6U87_03895 [Firmicutes bacterium]|nr:hypothetical protein [Bacillota bacterium]
MRTIRYRWHRHGRGRVRLVGVALIVAGAIVLIKIVPLGLWPVGIGLWLVWAGLGPLLAAGALIWLGWRLIAV